MRSLKALLLAAIISAPHFVLCFKFGPASIPVPLNHNDSDAYCYIARIYSCFRGHWLNGFSFVQGHADDPFIQPNMTENLAAYLLWPIKAYPQLLVAVGTFIFVGLAAYVLIVDWSFTGAVLAFVLLGNIIHRPIQPQGNYFIYALCFGLYYRAWMKPCRSNPVLIYLGLAMGLLPYLYVFYAYYFGILAIFLMESSALFIAAILWMPYFMHNVTLSLLPYFKDLIFTIGFTHGHFPSIMRSVKFVVIAAAILPWISDKKHRHFFGMVFLAALILYNQQVLTGILPHDGEFHFWRVFSLPVSAAIMTALVLRGWNSGRLTVALLAVLIGQQVADYRASLALFDQRIMDYQPAFNWLNEHARPGDVVMAEKTPSMVLPIMTKQDVFASPWGFVFIQRQELWSRNFQLLSAYGMPNSKVDDYIVANHFCFWGVGQDMEIGRQKIRRYITGHKWREMIDPVLHGPKNMAGYYHGMAKTMIRPASSHIRVDFMLYGPFERETFPEFDPSGRIAYQDTRVSIIEELK